MMAGYVGVAVVTLPRLPQRGVGVVPLVPWPRPRVAVDGSSLVAAVEAAYGAIKREAPDLPDAVIITGSGLSGYGLVWGHFAHDRWIDDIRAGRRPELFVSGERLAGGATLTMQTLLHEAAHALAIVRGVKDTSRGFRYHNRRFVALAESLGLEYVPDAPDPSIGYSAVTLTRQGKRQWRTAIDDLERALTLHLSDPTALLAPVGGSGGGHGPGGVRRPRGTGGTSYVKATCACPRIIRLSQTELDGEPITCGACGEVFS